MATDNGRQRPGSSTDVDALLTANPDLRPVNARVPILQYVASLWAARAFIAELPRSSLAARDQDTTLGNLWHLLNPLMLAGVYYIVFGIILEGVRGGIENYPAFLVTGIFVFYYIRRSFASGARSIIANTNMLQSIRFPRAALPISTTLAEMASQGWALGAMFVLVMFTGVTPKASWLLVIPIALVQTVFCLGGALVLARMTFHFRDIQNLLNYALQIWLYLSGVFFTADRIGDPTLRTIFELNPGYAFIHLNRLAVLDGTTSLYFWVICIAWSLIALAVGLPVFLRRETDYGRD